MQQPCGSHAQLTPQQVLQQEIQQEIKTHPLRQLQLCRLCLSQQHNHTAQQQQQQLH